MKRIIKAEFTVVWGHVSLFKAEMPPRARIVWLNPGESHVWAEVDVKDVELPPVIRMFELFQGESIIPPLSEHLVSFVNEGEVFHFYDHGEVQTPIGG